MTLLLLAAGLSKRMGRHKMLLPLNGITLLERLLLTVSSVGFSKVVLVINSQIDQTINKKLDDFSIVINKTPEAGQALSLTLGLSAMDPADDFTVLLADLPYLRTDQIKESLDLFFSIKDTYSALIPKRAGQYGHPSIFSPIWRDRFQSLSGDMGGRKIIEANHTEVFFYSGHDSYFTDVDTPEDYNALKENLKSMV